MQLWFSRRTEVPLRDQLATQLAMAILSGDLSAGERLPSTRELARRFRLHPNTVSAAYRQLERQHWVESRRGSGVFVRESPTSQPLSPMLALDHMIGQLFRTARELGFSRAAAQERLRHWLDLRPPDHFLLIEPEPELAEIAALEIGRLGSLPVRCRPPCEHFSVEDLAGAVPLVFPSKAEAVRRSLPAGTELVVLQVQSIQSALAAYLPALPSAPSVVPSDRLVAVASRWPRFLDLARTMLISRGFDPDSLMLCDARREGWQRGFDSVAAVVCDAVTEMALPPGIRAIAFALLAEETVAELSRCGSYDFAAAFPEQARAGKTPL
jgi:GntR family transcriptional regulator